ncbi:DUF4870 domain-containing protein [Rothia terrae]|uniref:DUF4870 domain-containing protein n=1 Tax=Rothia terrae TaxID=396015 RepID=A0A7H2BD84_9MICC|nr:DUF4870 domain-containing protein [Rothia terrae]QNV37630.1 DUF4870 domain-containing protein [Rothia terrae]
MSTSPNPENPNFDNENRENSAGQNPYGSYRHSENQQGQHQQPRQLNEQPGQFTQQPGNVGFGGQQGYGQPHHGQFNQNTGFGGQQQTFDAYGNPIPSDAKMIAVLSHLSSLVATVLSATFLSFVAPLIFWFIYKDKPGYAFVRVASAGAFNFNFTMWVINMAAWLVIAITFGIAAVFMWIVFLATTIAMLIFHIIAAVKANNGEVYNYPMQIRILK